MMKKITKNSSEYWARRKAEFVVSQLDKAEQTAEVMKRSYAKAQNYLVDQTDKIFLKYQRDYKLSETQARAILKRSGVDVMKLKRELQNGVQSDEIKQILTDMDSAAYASRIEKLIQSQKDIDALMVSMSQNDNRLLTNHLNSIVEDSYLHEMFLIQKRAKVAFEFSALDPKYVDKLLRVNWSGKHFSNAIWNNHAELGQTLKEEYLVNYLTGRSSFDMAKVIEERFGVEGYKARRLVRTESTFFSAELEAKAYEEAGIEKYEYVSVLDDRTTHICKSKDGKIYNVKDRRAGVNYPPLHVFCRATTIAHISDEWLKEVDGDVFDDTLGYKKWKKAKKPLKNKAKKVYNKGVQSRTVISEKTIENKKIISFDKNIKTLKNIDGYMKQWEKEVVSNLPIELSEKSKETIERAIENGNFAMRFKSQNLDNLISKERFLNQFETKTSGGTVSTKFRKQATEQLFGIGTKGMKYKEYEKYGYIGNKNPMIDYTHNLRSGGVSQYGDMIIHFNRDKIAGRVTFVIDNSLGNAVYKNIVADNPFKIKLTSIDKNKLRQYADLLQDDLISGPEDLVKRLNVRYIEAQYHGDLLLSDVDTIYFTKTKPNFEQIKLLSEKNINIYVLEGENFVKIT